MALVEIPWHEGELKVHRLLRPPNNLNMHNPTSPFLTPRAAGHMLRAPLLAIGALDEQGRPWTTVWADGGRAGFMEPVGQSIMAIKVPADASTFDPVAQILLAHDYARHGGNGSKKRKMVGALTIDLKTRSRVKLFGRMIDNAGQGDAAARVVVSIEQSCGNCPKYITARALHAGPSKPTLVADSLPLPAIALDLISKADLFFISTAHADQDMDTNNRGGPPGFVRVVSNADDGTVLAWPEYSGNRFYMTLGNLATTPRAGLVFPDFATGDVLYVTGETETLIGAAAEEVLVHSNIVVRLRVTGARYLRQGLNFRGEPGDLSPYNPRLRLLRSEGAVGIEARQEEEVRATLIKQDRLTPTVYRSRFRVLSAGEPVTWKPGQYVALSFEGQLSKGYSHMRDDDPRSLNDDYVRTFTVSSAPVTALPCAGDLTCEQPPNGEFEITYRVVGRVTDFLSAQHPGFALEVPVRGFEGTFSLPTLDGETSPLVGYVTGGVGITPLLAHLPVLHQTGGVSRVRLFWAVRREDLNLVVKTFEQFPRLADVTHVFVTGNATPGAFDHELRHVREKTTVFVRRLARDDVQPAGDAARSIKTWYICAGKELREAVKGWLEADDPGKEIIMESFDY